MNLLKDNKSPGTDGSRWEQTGTDGSRREQTMESCYFQMFVEHQFSPYINLALEVTSVPPQKRYRNANSSVTLAGGTCPTSDLSTGVRQGRPVSPYLLLLVAQLLADHIRSGKIQGVSLLDRSLIVTQLADGATLILKNKIVCSSGSSENALWSVWLRSEC